MVSVCIFLITSDVKHHLLCVLDICVFSFIKPLLTYFPILNCFVFLLSGRSSLCILGTVPLPDVSCEYLLLFYGWSFFVSGVFERQKFLILVKSC